MAAKSKDEYKSGSYRPEDHKVLRLENVKVIVRNFSGAPDRYSENPTPSFGIILNEDDVNVAAIEKDDWYVRRLKPKADDPEQYRQPWIKVYFKMDGRKPPIIELIKNGRRFRMTKETVGQLDWTKILYADCIIKSNRYDPDKPMSAWLEDLRIVAQDTDLESKYNDIPYAEEVETQLPFPIEEE